MTQKKTKPTEGKGIKETPIITSMCNLCGKIAPIDYEKSNDNWTVYKTGLCNCGGNYELKATYAKR